MHKFHLYFIGFLILVVLIFSLTKQQFFFGDKKINQANTFVSETLPTEVEKGVSPLSIAYLRDNQFAGSELAVEETLEAGVNYQRYLVSYRSENFKIYALLTVPDGIKPANGWPAIVFNHGYIPPVEYRTTERYISYVDSFARNGYVVLKPDYRGHGNSEGEAAGGYGSNVYTVDVLNALSSIKKYPSVDSEKIGMWGHSMGGFITLRSMVSDKKIKAGVIWGGVVVSYQDLLTSWRRRTISPSGTSRPGSWRQRLVEKYGSWEKNPSFWLSISANNFLKDISGPLQLHHGEDDTSVPVEFSLKLFGELKNAQREVEFFSYPGNDHNISQSFSLAMQRSVDFFDKYLKEKEVGQANSVD